MATKVINKDVNFKEIEDINNILASNSNIVLRIPNTLSTGGAFGIEGFLLQSLATWLRQDGDKVLHTYIKDGDDTSSFDELCNSIFGVCALSLSDTILTSSKERISRRTSLLQAVDRIESIRNEVYKHAFKGSYVAIPSIKTPGNNTEQLNPFYNGYELVGREKFLNITSKSIDAVLHNNKYQFADSVISNIAEIIRELFTNTEKHARRDVKGNILNKNFRVVTYRTASISKKRLDKMAMSGGTKISSFISESFQYGSEFLPILDISVIDSGPGYARRWTGLEKNELDFEKERSAILDCFKKYKSTDLNESSGSGLSNVLRDLKRLRGFFRLRTGGTLIQKSFYNEKYKKGSVNLKETDVMKMDAHVEGVAFNILIPLQGSENVLL